MKLVLAALFSGPYKDIIGFKGGTLAYLCYGLDRFSTDIDIDLLDLTHEQAVISYLNAELALIAEVTDMIVGRDLHRRKLRYDMEGRNIKVELNKRETPYTTYERKKIDGMQVQCQSLLSMTSNKLLALGERRYNRDLYDIHFFLTQGYGFDEKIIYDRSQYTVVQYIQKIMKAIPEHYQSTSILHQLGEVVGDDKKQHVKSHLIDETIKLLQLYIDKQ